MPIHRKTAFVASSLEPMVLCGQTIGWHFKVENQFEKPFQINPTKGNHDFNTCKTCQANLVSMTKCFKEKFDGKDDKKGFPFCCIRHAKLEKEKVFNRADYETEPYNVALKITYTKQHIINNLERAEWYKEITDYIEWVVMSFGQLPNNCGEPFLLSTYFSYIIDYVNNTKSIPVNKRKAIKTFIEELKSPAKEPSNETTDLNVLFDTYGKWVKIFPFELKSYFGNMKEQIMNYLPLLKDKPETNSYSGLAKAKLHTKESLVEVLVKLTNDLLTRINGLALHEKWSISDADKVKLELIINSRKLKISEGYTNNSQSEERKYRRILKAWFEDEKKFVNEIAPLLKSSPTTNEVKREDAQPVISKIKNNFDSVGIQIIFDFFKKALVEKNYLTEETLMKFIELAFEKREVPATRFKFQNIQTKQKIIKVFYDYYRNLAGKPHGKQRQYAELLGNYFEGYSTENVRTNFNK